MLKSNGSNWKKKKKLCKGNETEKENIERPPKKPDDNPKNHFWLPGDPG